ncbi:hypothetical protein [Corynebacterium pacaense]|uniref:hypothetical protein n=1 Tax=Corynebacterium pacaense TaxID=1816684 RepID=UPI0009BB4EB1|nr:hypothetical protein [Corynebacterium pacaense]
MSDLPTEFHSDLFPAINDHLEFRGLTYVFFEQFTLPTPEQLELVASQLPGWSLITWGWWNGDADIEDQDIEAITDDGDSLSTLSETIIPSDLLGEGREPQPIEAVESLESIYAEQDNWGLVAISCPTWTTVAACEWRGCMNVAEPGEMALALKSWNTAWGVEVLAFGGEEDDADLLLRVPPAHTDNPDMIHAFAVAADQVTVFNDPALGQLISLWFD